MFDLLDSALIRLGLSVPPHIRELREGALYQCFGDLLAGLRVAALVFKACNSSESAAL